VIRSGGRLGLAAISGGGGVALGLQNSVLDVGSAGGNSTLTKTGLGTQTLSGIDRVEVKIRRTLAENGKLYARLKVLVAP